MSNSNISNFISGSVGSGYSFTQVVPDVVDQMPVDSTDTLIASLVTILGGLVSTIVTNFLRGLFKRKNKK